MDRSAGQSTGCGAGRHFVPARHGSGTVDQQLPSSSRMSSALAGGVVVDDEQAAVTTSGTDSAARRKRRGMLRRTMTAGSPLSQPIVKTPRRHGRPAADARHDVMVHTLARPSCRTPNSTTTSAWSTSHDEAMRETTCVFRPSKPDDRPQPAFNGRMPAGRPVDQAAPWRRGATHHARNDTGPFGALAHAAMTGVDVMGDGD